MAAAGGCTIVIMAATESLHCPSALDTWLHLYTAGQLPPVCYSCLHAVADSSFIVLERLWSHKVGQEGNRALINEPSSSLQQIRP